jgi:hypothetical protein
MTKRLVILGVLLAARSVMAQPTPDAPAASPPAASEEPCKAALEAREVKASERFCELLGAAVVTKMLAASRVNGAANGAAFAASAGQPRITDTPGAQGTSGQTAAVASGQPVATTGGSVAAVGDTGQGLQLVTALAINPASIVLGDTSTSSVWASRLADISIVLPLNIDPADRTKKGFQYIGARFRLNTLAALHASELEREVERTVGEYTKLGDSAGSVQTTVTELLVKASDPGKCASAIENANEADQKSFCGRVVEGASLASTARAARAALAQFREDTDRKYLSLEARFDHGDLNADAAAKKDSLLAAYLAAGYGFHSTSDGNTLELRARGGFVYFQDGATDTARAALFGALGVELAVVRDLKRYCLSVALELTRQRGNDRMPPAAGVNAVRLGVAVPLADGKVVSVGVAIPTGSGESTIALSGDWSLLFGK